MDDERITRFLDAQEHPEKYTEEELKDILQDSKGLAELKRALIKEKASKTKIDVDAEWETFCKEYASKEIQKDTNKKFGIATPSLGRVGEGLRIAAMFIGVILVAGIAYAAMVNFGVINGFSHKDDVVAKDSIAAPVVAKSIENKATADTIMQEKKAESTTKVFDNETLANILNEMGKYYGVDIDFANENSKSIRLYFEWNQAKSLDENIKLLNSFQQIAITFNGNVVTVN